MTAKTIFKTKINISPKWILTHFPIDYENMIYIEPYVRSLGTLFLKKKSQLEIINDEDKGVTKLLKSLRNEPKELIAKLKKIQCTDRTFQIALKEKEFENQLDHAINEFILRKMSRNGNKKTFNGSETWIESVKDLCELAPRIQNIIILNKKSSIALKAFDEQNSLCYTSMPDTTEDNSDFFLDEVIEISDHFNNFLGKVVLSGYLSPLYKRLFKTWRVSKQLNKSGKTECVWCNF